MKRRLFKGRVESFDDDLDEEDASKQGRERGVFITAITGVSIVCVTSYTYQQKIRQAQKERQKQEEATSAALAKEFDEIQARIDADHELAVRLTHKEQEKYTIEERARLLVEFFERRKKKLAAERAEIIRKKPPIRTQKLYEREKKWIDNFKPIDDDSQQQAESTKKRPRADSEEESFKKQKLEEDNDAKKRGA
ncbi:hypothetical protein Tco_1490499 [Tanacetum coccineum]